MNKIVFFPNKTLKLQNVLEYKMPTANKKIDPQVAIMQMEAYIKANDAAQIGPLIQHTSYSVTSKGKVNLGITLMLQCDKMIKKVNDPYRMRPLIRVENALYVRFNGPKEKLPLAYSKIQIEAFENNINHGEESYTIYINEYDGTDSLIVDIFVPTL